MKKLGYILFAAFFHIFRIFPINSKKVFCVATHDSSSEGNIGIVVNALKKQEKSYHIVILTRKDGIRKPFSFFIGKAFHMATAGTILEDNEFLPMAYLHFSKKVKVVQLWHGTGTIKKFGQDANSGELADLEKRVDERITHLIVNSEFTKKQYAHTFGMEESRALVLGLPRSDLLQDTEYLEKRRKKFYMDYPELRNKRIVLYAPTFRDSQADHPTLPLDFREFANELPKDTVMLLRLHPFVAQAFDSSALRAVERKIMNMSDYVGVTTLLAVADILVTDYSSIVFEFCLLKKPMIFYAYDLEQFRENGRDFYEDYETMVPGPIVKNQAELLDAIEKVSDNPEIVEQFVQERFAFTDGKATERLVQHIFK